jgi:hypothetical protein
VCTFSVILLLLLFKGNSRKLKKIKELNRHMTGEWTLTYYHLIYKDEFLFVCLYVCLYLIQIHISEPIGTKLCTRLPLVWKRP